MGDRLRCRARRGQGIGAALLGKLIAAAHTLEIQTIVGYVLPDNTYMLRLGRKTGFRQRHNREMGAIELTIDIPTADAELPAAAADAPPASHPSCHDTETTTV